MQAADHKSLKNTTTEITFDGKPWHFIDYDDSTVTLLSKECVAASQYNSNGSRLFLAVVKLMRISLILDCIFAILYLQYQAGGMVIFLEANNEDKLLSFYGNNRFQPFDRRTAEKKDKEPHELIQLLRLL